MPIFGILGGSKQTNGTCSAMAIVVLVHSIRTFELKRIGNHFFTFFRCHILHTCQANYFWQEHIHPIHCQWFIHRQLGIIVNYYIMPILAFNAHLDNNNNVGSHAIVQNGKLDLRVQRDTMRQHDYFKKGFHVFFPNFVFILINFGTFFWQFVIINAYSSLSTRHFFCLSFLNKCEFLKVSWFLVNLMF
jgi:hypothetical protein